MRKSITAVMIIMLLAAPVFAADAVLSRRPAAPKVMLGALIREALNNNPRLKAAQYRAAAARARVALFRDIPDPMLEYEYDRITPGALMGDGGKIVPMRSLAVSQQIPFPTKLYMRRKAAQKEFDALEKEYKETERGVVKDVKEAYYNLFLDRRKVAFIRDSLNLMGQFVDVTNKKYAVKKAGQQDVLRAQVEYSRLSNTVILYEKESRIAESLLISLLGRKDDVAVDISDADPVTELALKEEDIVTLAKKDRPELGSVRDMLAKVEADRSLSQQEFLPDITLKYKREEKNSSLRNGEWTGMVGINVPLWFWGKQMAGVREAQANLDAAKADYTSAENSVVFEARSAFARYEAARQLVAIYETGVLSQAEAAVITARRAYESGTLGFLELLDSLRTLRDLQMEYFEAVAQAQVALADLEQTVGGDLVK